MEARGPEFSVRAVVVGLLVAAFVGVSFPYVILRIGFAPNISVVSAFLGYLVLMVLSAVSMRLLKKAIYNAAHLTFEQAGDDIATKTAVSDFHDDAHDGSKAFFEKRPAVFNTWLEAADAPDRD